MTQSDRNTLVDHAMSSLARANRHTFAIIRNPQDNNQLILTNQNRASDVAFLRLEIKLGNQLIELEESSFQGRLILNQSTNENKCWFVLTNDAWECIASSVDEPVHLHLIALCAPGKYQKYEHNPYADVPDYIPIAINARFCGSQHKEGVATVGILRDPHISKLWHYEGNLMCTHTKPIAVTDGSSEIYRK